MSARSERRRPVPAGVLAALALAACAALPARVAAVDLGDVFRTPDERAAERLRTDAGRAELAASPDPEWAAHARYLDGDVAAAAASFETALASEADPEARRRLRYNRATALTRAGRYDEAITTFDDLLDERPDDPDVTTNRGIAERLAALAKDEPAPDGQEGEQGQQGQPGQPGQPDEEAGSEDAGAPGSAGRAGESADAGPDARGDGTDGARDADGKREEGDGPEGESDAGGAGRAERSGKRDGEPGADPHDEPLGEQEQAIEQWLRQIPDDPSGLLRRKLVQSHRRDWPDVRENGDGW